MSTTIAVSHAVVIDKMHAADKTHPVTSANAMPPEPPAAWLISRRTP